MRLMSKQLSININTVRNSYQLLVRDNLIKIRHGSGAIVLPIDSLLVSRKLQKNRSHTIGVILPGISDPFYHKFLQGIEEIAGAEQIMIFLCDAHEDPKEAFRFYLKLIAKQVDGIICASLPLNQFISRSDEKPRIFPLVSVDWPSDVMNSVLLDQENSGFLATRHLLDHGYRRIGLITIQGDAVNTIPLHYGYVRALNEYGVDIDPELVAKVASFSLEDGANGAGRLLALANKPDAIFAITDVLALGALQYLKERGLNIPGDVAIIGVGDINLAGLVNPPLTTVSLPAFQLGIDTMKMLQRLIDGESLEEGREILPTTLVVRRSCGCQRK